MKRVLACLILVLVVTILGTADEIQLAGTWVFNPLMAFDASSPDVRMQAIFVHKLSRGYMLQEQWQVAADGTLKRVPLDRSSFGDDLSQLIQETPVQWTIVCQELPMLRLTSNGNPMVDFYIEQIDQDSLSLIKWDRDGQQAFIATLQRQSAD